MDQDTLELYVDGAGEHRWRYRSAGNHKILADSGEGYGDPADAERMALRVMGIPAPSAGLTAGAGAAPWTVTRADGTSVTIVRGAE